MGAVPEEPLIHRGAQGRVRLAPDSR